ncbi:hypothetical protein EJ110_NYTH53994 [Nymphaea thermarum]|nr:hypothetical protein EJ110_NYTH53994 [Nymphaea thermarum]
MRGKGEAEEGESEKRGKGKGGREKWRGREKQRGKGCSNGKELMNIKVHLFWHNAVQLGSNLLELMNTKSQVRKDYRPSMASSASSSTGTSPSLVMAAKYPYPSNVNVANFVSIKLSHKNYLLWKTQMFGLIESQDMMGFIERQISIQTSTIEIVENGEARSVPNPEFLAWKKSDRLLRGWITGSLSEEVLGLVVGLQTSSDVWTALLKVFARESKDREFLLTRKLQMFQKQEKTVTEYVTGFKTICDELAAIGKPLSDQDKVYWLINGLGSGYESFMTLILWPPIPAYIDVVSLLESHDNMKNIHGFQLNHNAAFLSQQVPAQPSYSHNYRGRA